MTDDRGGTLDDQPTIEVYDRGYVRRDQLRPDNLALLHYGNGTIRILHPCKTVDGRQLICAPALQLDNGHRVEQLVPITISPSISCPDCGLHGFVRSGRWEAC